MRIAFGIGAACVGVAGTLLLLLVDVQPYLGGDYTLLSFIIVIIGGLGSMPGALLGGLLVGVSEGLSASYSWRPRSRACSATASSSSCCWCARRA